MQAGRGCCKSDRAPARRPTRVARTSRSPRGPESIRADQALLQPPRGRIHAIPSAFFTDFEIMAHVLIVDDDETDRLLMRTILGGAGHDLFFASNGEEALKLYLRHPIEVVVTDIQMPRGDGIELITALKGLDPEASIVAVSGQKPHKLQVAQLAGARVILPKPLTKDGLTNAVEKACLPPAPDPLGC
jgi:CheY-like chemotaxis protein